MPLLHPGDTFPQLFLNIPGAQAIQVAVIGGSDSTPLRPGQPA